MKSPGRLLVFALGALGVFLLAFGLGRMAEPDTSTDDHDDHPSSEQTDANPHDDDRSAYRLDVGDVAPGGDELTFQVLDADDEVVTDYDVRHERELHLIAVRTDDLTDYQHLHPERDADGTWRVEMSTFPGTYRLYADTQPADAEPQVVEADLEVPGTGQTQMELPEPATAVDVDGFRVALDASDDAFRFTVTRDGEPVKLQPYLGAGGHLVAIHADDLGYAHVHPVSARGNTVGFGAELECPGTHVLYLDFKVAGEVRTAIFTYDAPEPGDHGSQEDLGDGEDHGNQH